MRSVLHWGNMPKGKSLRKLRGYSFLSQITSIFVFTMGALSIVLFIRPTLLGVPSDSIGRYQGQCVWFIFGLVFIMLAVFFNTIAYRWPRVLLRILRTQPSSTMRLQLKTKEDNDSTEYVAYLTEISSADDASTWRVRLWAVSEEAERWLDRVCSVKVYRDPKTGKPAVIELEDTYLWAMKEGVERIKSLGR